MKQRVLIQNVRPQLDGGQYAIKRVVGESVQVQADIFSDGHDVVRAVLCYKTVSAGNWETVFMEALPNDAWEGVFQIEEQESYIYTIHAWIDHLATWRQGFVKKYADRQDMAVELLIGAKLLREAATLYAEETAKPLLQRAETLEDAGAYQRAVQVVLSRDFAALVYEHPMKRNHTVYAQELRVWVNRKKALFSTWYEFFPRSVSEIEGKHGTFQDCERLLPRVASMGFDVLYFPPIHPVGKIHRKGRNNAVTAAEGEPGSPWAIGSDEGGHKSVNPELGSMEDYERLIKKAKEQGIEIALDLALQCAPDHPYIKAHPEWFVWRPDNTIAYAEDPPQRYEDIVPINFECDDWQNLWEELKSIVLFWIEKGIQIFRVDNPHTKSFLFWEWCIAEVHAQYPEVIFLAEALTRPRLMQGLAKLGFSQSYSYFTWRNTRQEIESYMTELTQTDSREYYRPNFWPNTPDILPFFLQTSGPNGFHIRYVLAATLSSNVGVYGPAYEHYINDALPGKEEYGMSEKFEFKAYDWEEKTPMATIMTRINQLRRENPALQTTWNIQFTESSNENILSYIKWSEDLTNIIWCIVNLDPQHTQNGHVEVPEQLYALCGGTDLYLHELLTNETFHWKNAKHWIVLDPLKFSFHIMQVFAADYKKQWSKTIR